MKKLISLISVAAIVASLSITCFAAEANVSGPSGIMPASQEEIAQWNAESCETQESVMEILQQEPAISPAAASSWHTISGFTYYGQEKFTSCGAAAVKMLLKALTGTVYSESTIRTGCKWDEDSGTTIANSVSYVNGVQSDHSYTAKYSIIHSWFTNNIYNAITDNAPAIVSIVTTVEDGWFYNTSGHALTLYGVRADKSEYKIADPWGGYAGVSEWEEYQKNDAELFDAYAWTHGYMV